MIKYRIFACIVILLIGWSILSAQTNQPASQPSSQVFQQAQEGIIAGEITSFSRLLAKQVYLDLPGEDARYYSVNQAFLILQNFFGARKTIQFKFSTIDTSEAGMFATGSGTFLVRGRKETLQVYLLVSNIDGKFVISQFNVY